MSTQFNISNFRAQVLGGGLARPSRFEVLFTLPPQIQLMPKYNTVYNAPNSSVFQNIGNVLGAVGAVGNIIKSRAVGSALANMAISAITGAQKDKPINMDDARRVSLLCDSANFPPLTINTKAQRIYGPAYQRPVGSDYGGDGISLTFHVDRQMLVKRLFDAWMETIVSGGLAPGEYKNSYTVAFPRDYLTNIIINQLDEADNVIYSIKLEDAFPRTMNIMDLNNSSQNLTHKLTIMFAYRRWYPLAQGTQPQSSSSQPSILQNITSGINKIYNIF